MAFRRVVQKMANKTIASMLWGSFKVYQTKALNPNCVCVCVCVCVIYIYIHILMYIYVHTNICIHVCVCVCVYTHTGCVWVGAIV